MKRIALRLAVLLVVVLLSFILLFGPGLLAAPITLLIGWWSSMARLVKIWHPGSTGIVLFAFAAILLVTGTHGFLRWIYAGAHRVAEGSAPGAWRWKWTVCGFGLITCTLLAICAMVLTTHQVYWISKSSDPLFADPFRERVQMLRLTMDLQKQAEELKWDSAKTRKRFFQQDGFAGSGQSAPEAIQPVWIEKDEHSLRAIILLPRRPLHRAMARLAVLQPGTNSTTHHLEDLPKVLASLGVGSAQQHTAGTAIPLP